jgi:CheY-like chemotaxis protein
MLNGKRLLIIEDDLRAVANFKFYFSEMDELTEVSVLFAVSFEEAVGILDNGVFDLVYLDLSLGNSKNPAGLDILEKYSKIFNIVVVSGFNDYEGKCLALGAKGFITKPVDINKMLLEGEKILLKTLTQQRN